MWVHDLRDADASCGGKAVGLARLLAAGLPVPAGFVIADRAFREVVGDLELSDVNAAGHALTEAADRIATAKIPPELEREVQNRAAEIGPVLAVRSSATIEDGDAGAAAGVFSSRRGVRSAELWDAIRAVWTSALTPLAATYARRRSGPIAIGVIIQRHADGVQSTVYTRPPGHPTEDEVLIQQGEHVVRCARGDARARLAIAAELAIHATGGADVELAGEWIVQARPIVHRTPHAHAPPPPAVLAALTDGRTWTWDVAHNPDPLSLAQVGLVESVERAAIAPWSLRVCSGFLYTSPRAHAPAPIVGPGELAIRAAQLEVELERALGTAPPASVADAIERYVAFYRIWAGELAPLISAARSASSAQSRPATGDRPSAVESTLTAAARGELSEADVVLRLGALSPAWDVAVMTFGERPGLLRDAIARASTRQVDPPRPAPRLDELATLAADLAERDDALFARAQLLVRQALLARAAELGLYADDIFWLPLDETASVAAIDPDDAHRRASAARAAADRAARWQMPLVVGAAPAATGPALRGIGTGARVTGRVVRFASLARAIAAGSGDVIVTRAVTPALAVFVVGCAALVSETGGLLDHGASLARELGIPCIVGCRDAWQQLTDGMIVIVDGEAGTVTPT